MPSIKELVEQGLRARAEEVEEAVSPEKKLKEREELLRLSDLIYDIETGVQRRFHTGQIVRHVMGERAPTKVGSLPAVFVKYMPQRVHGWDLARDPSDTESTSYVMEQDCVLYFFYKGHYVTWSGDTRFLELHPDYVEHNEQIRSMEED